MAAKKKKATTGKRTTKSAFIRGFGPDTPAEEIVAKGKAAGLTFTKKYVWTKQSEMRTGKAKTKNAPKGPKAAEAPTAEPTTTPSNRRGTRSAARVPKAPRAAVSAQASDAEQVMRSLIVQLGTTRADEIYQKVRAQLDAVVGGR